MRILHVVTLVSPDGAFGGPVRVAANQCAALRARGHDVRILAGTRGFGDEAPDELDGTPLSLFPVTQLVPGTGFSGLTSLALQRSVRASLPAADVVHVHLARDLVTLPAAGAALRAGVPYVLQPHGMVVDSGNPLAGPLDAVLTRRVLAGASAVLHLTPEERAGLESVSRGAVELEQLGNGVPVPDHVPSPVSPPEVLFCARLHKRKRPALFASAARELLAEGVEATFALVGPDEGEGAAVAAEVDAVGDADVLRWEGALDPSQTLDRMARASVVALPSVDEPYPMTVLEAMSAGRAVVVTDSCGLAPAVLDHACGLVVDDSREAFVGALRALLADPAGARAMGERAARAAREQFGMDVVTDRLVAVYERASAAT